MFFRIFFRQNGPIFPPVHPVNTHFSPLSSDIKTFFAQVTSFRFVGASIARPCSKILRIRRSPMRRRKIYVLDGQWPPLHILSDPGRKSAEKGTPFGVPLRSLAAAAVSLAAATHVAAVAEQQDQNDDPPPVVVQAAAQTVIVVAHNRYLRDFSLSIAAHTPCYDLQPFLCAPRKSFSELTEKKMCVKFVADSKFPMIEGR